jgi:hypothetical protein
MRTATSVPAPTCDLATTGSTVIPAAGGNLNYNFTGNNATGSTVNFDAWTDVSMPNYGPYTNALFVRSNLSLAPVSNLTHAMIQSVPGSTPAGYYYHYGYLGLHSQLQIYSWDYFYFSKSSVDGGSPVENWGCDGWDCDPVMIEEVPLPQTITLAASPNPFNPVTMLNFALPQAGQVQVDVFNSAGQLLTTLVNGWRAAGVHEVTFDAGTVPSGIYLARLQCGRAELVQKMLLVK